MRAQFYLLNEKFEGFLNLRPIKSINLQEVEFEKESVLRVLNSLRLEEKEEVLSEEIKQMEEEIDMREYYEIKRPTVVFFEAD